MCSECMAVCFCVCIGLLGGVDRKSPLNAQHIAEGAKEGDSKAKDGDRDGDRGVAGTLLGSGNFRADEVSDGVAAALGCNLLDHCDLLFGVGRM